jgi:hypothetical protein
MYTEEWRPIEGQPGYQVSSMGRVKGLSGKIMKPIWIQSKYGQICFRDGTRKLVSHLVLEAFVGQRPRPNTRVVRADNNTRNDRVTNLSWRE